MKIDLTKFTNTLPYGSELFGIYQPLLGWRSRLTKDRMSQGESVISSLTTKAINRTAPEIEVTENAISSYGISVSGLVIPQPYVNSFMLRIAADIDSCIARQVSQSLPPQKKPKHQEWKKFLDLAKVLNPALEKNKDIIIEFVINSGDIQVDPGFREYLNYAVEESQRKHAYIPPYDDGEVPRTVIIRDLLKREAAISGYLNWLAMNKSDLLNTLFYRDVYNPFDDLMRHQDPLDTFGSNDLDAALSPIGIVHLFRQYFFEFDTFLGTPVGHVWLSPGGTVELVETSSRKVIVERTIELFSETDTKSETSTRVQDELAEAVKEENRMNIKFGFGANVHYDNGTLEAGANTDFSLENSRTSSREVSHKQLREQSEKLSNEIKQSYRTTFKTTTETLDTSSKRYVLQNTTNTLVNYELRRKMRQIGVQVQDINTQLCWQVYVDDPGMELGIAKLLHIAESPNLANIQPPDAPAQLVPKNVDVNIQFPYMRDPSSEGGGETDVTYYDGDDRESTGDIHHLGYNDRIFYTKQYTITPPATGYLMGPTITLQSQHSGVLVAEASVLNPNAGLIEIVLHQVNFQDQPFVNFQVTTTWTPDPTLVAAQEAAYRTKLVAFEEEKRRQEQEEFLKVARERIKLASQIKKRKFEDLREEERTVVYRNLLRQLMSVGANAGQEPHVTAELIRAIFDVDKMLYFVAPEWWRPRKHYRQQFTPAGMSETIPDDQVISWGGAKEQERSNHPDNYYITEDSDPAPLGSSLGWLLQLDGDNFRNAFLNSPWVKAVIPILPGKEEAAINWLTLAHVEGTDGLESEYIPSDPATADAELDKIRKRLKELGHPITGKVTIHHALQYLADQVKQQYRTASTAQPSPFDPNKNTIPTEVVYEHGFNPLQGSFEVNTDPLKVFSQWVEVLPTDQVVALEYNAQQHL